MTRVDLSHSGGRPWAKKPACTFWTGRDGQLCVQSFRPEDNVHYQPHAHSEYGIVICLAGEIVLTQLGQTQTIGPQGVMMANYGVEHASSYLSRAGEPCEVVCLAFDRRLLAAMTTEFALPPAAGGTCPAFLGTMENATLHECAQGIAEELQTGQPGHKLVIETLATRMLVETLRAWPRANIVEIAADTAARLPQKDFVRAYEFMRGCRKENFRLQHLCQFLGSSEERFTRLFLATTRKTPASFYNQLLLARARDLLRDPGLSIKEIGFELGFKTSSHFIAAFRREFAASPQEYRQRSHP